ncbi:DddA-like double-stranded DNA deaminase toxin [Actinopolyspora mortivallis]|uniref:DddA-like double-stranded DNA deaminase toxin n=1 Tax=Actinopolyspora mortivallis TaxID=33906 RepID=UPI0003815E8A|nr:DddA-like double-stranded DNA deaminase toxin [Actinopolyspora mortivallis]
MRETVQTYGVIVLNKDMCTGQQRCFVAVRAILPRGSTLVVWEPGTQHPVTVHGEARP